MKENGKTKIIVFSDSHGSSALMLKTAELYRYSADYFIFLGDGLRDAEKIRDLTDKPLITVSGNCDSFFPSALVQKAPPSCVLSLECVSLLVCHGHTFNVKYSLDALISAARERSADIALFGHTHLPYEEYIATDSGTEKPIWLFNPGSIAKPREGKPSYGIIDIFLKDGKRSVLLSHGTAG
ncbi:MAG: metallophosphoesterase [Clostridia bacterium]|nr:metallophosphoesterase [Clostridia bacterium]